MHRRFLLRAICYEGGIIMPNSLCALGAAAAFVACASLSLSAVAQGMIIVSQRNQGLAINAWGGANQGTILRLHNGCRPTNPDCTWTYQNGMLISDRDRRLAINAWGGARHGTVLRLSVDCTPNNPDCLWDWQTNGMIVSQRDRSLAINAWDGALHGTVLRLHNGCRDDNPDCVWRWRRE